MTDPTPTDVPVLGVMRVELPLAPDVDQGDGCGCGGTAAKQLVARLRAEKAARAAAAASTPPTTAVRAADTTPTPTPQVATARS